MLPVAGIPAADNAGYQMNSVHHTSPSRRSAAAPGSFAAGFPLRRFRSAEAAFALRRCSLY